ncbi:MAG: nuclear transport factor 2 family protein [Propionicimonas sp.]
MDDLEGRVRRLEDHQSIVDVVIRYCVAVDRRDWVMFESCFAPSVRRDSGELTRQDFVAVVEGALPGFRSTQHLSSNHVVTFDPADQDRATCASDMYAPGRSSPSSRRTGGRKATSTPLQRRSSGFASRRPRGKSHLGPGAHSAPPPLADARSRCRPSRGDIRGAQHMATNLGDSCAT